MLGVERVLAVLLRTDITLTDPRDVSMMVTRSDLILLHPKSVARAQHSAGEGDKNGWPLYGTHSFDT